MYDASLRGCLVRRHTLFFCLRKVRRATNTKQLFASAFSSGCHKSLLPSFSSSYLLFRGVASVACGGDLDRHKYAWQATWAWLWRVWQGWRWLRMKQPLIIWTRIPLGKAQELLSVYLLVACVFRCFFLPQHPLYFNQVKRVFYLKSKIIFQIKIQQKLETIQ
jgi:hypothetical protein